MSSAKRPLDTSSSIYYTMDKDFYNEASGVKLGWNPTWFGENHFDEGLVEAIQRWQRKNSLKADGLCGPGTFRRIWTERQAEISDYKPQGCRLEGGEQKYIVHNGKFLEIEWDKVVLWDEPGGLKINPGKYYDNSGKSERKPLNFVNHWDVCLSAESCARILNKRGISVHFCLDNDGTIYQILDTQHGAWHCSSRVGNQNSIGIEISNAYYPKYQDWYVKNGFGERPIIQNATVHGKKLPDFTDFYPIQLEALKKLWKALHLGLNIPLEYPKTDGNFCKTVHKPSIEGTFQGFNNHYNYTKGKIDCAGLPLPRLLQEVEESLE
mgnify:FL=1